MKKFIITTDGNSDLTEAYAREHDIRLIPLYYNLDGKLYGGDDVLPPEEFYAKMREGKMPTTMAVNPQVVEKTFRSAIEEGYDILHIAFSSALSGSYNVTAMVGQQLCEELPDTKIIVIDSLSALCIMMLSLATARSRLTSIVCEVGPGLAISMSRFIQLIGRPYGAISSSVKRLGKCSRFRSSINSFFLFPTSTRSFLKSSKLS